MKKSALEALTGARFFAALYVLIVHCFMSGSKINEKAIADVPWPTANFLDRGCMAVDFFFILSGFILAYNYGSARGAMACSKHDFWAARFARIWPMFMVGLVVAAPIFYQTFHDPQLNPLHSIARAAVHVLGNALLLNAWFSWLNDINGPGWSLSAEAFFYLVFPFALGRLAQLPNRRLLRIAIFFYLISLLPPLIYCLWQPCSTHLFQLWVMSKADWRITSTIYCLPLFRLPEFLMGMALGIAFNRMPVARRKAVASNSALAVILLLIALAFTMKVPWPVLRNSFYAPLCVWVIWALAQEHDGLLYRFLSSKPCTLLGEASYGFYLFHYTFAHYILDFLVHAGFQPSLSLMIVLFLLTLTVVTPFSIILFWTIEEPMRRFLRNQLTADKKFHGSLQRT